MKKHIPNFLTCLNLFCGCVALVEIYKGHLITASYLIYAAAFLDLLDGMAARMLNEHSPYGKELDSLADVVSFGAVPGAMLFVLLQQTNLRIAIDNPGVWRIVQFIPFVVTVFSALRLAKFNVDTRQTTSFIGLPTPANTLFIVSLPFILKESNSLWAALILNPYFIIIASIGLSYLLVSELPMFSLKMKSFAFSANKIQYIFLALSLILVILLFMKAIPLIIILYILLSLLNYLFNTNKA